MNWLLKGLLLIVVSVCGFDGHTNFSRTRAETDNKQEQESPLQLTVKIVGSEYCTADSELDSLRLKVRLIYTNRGKQQLILYKGSRLISRTMISRNSADAAAKRFEVNASLTQLTSGGDKCYTGAAPNKCFVVLPPGASYGSGRHSRHICCARRC